MSIDIKDHIEPLPLWFKSMVYLFILASIPDGVNINPSNWYWTDWAYYALKTAAAGYVLHRAYKNRDKK